MDTTIEESNYKSDIRPVYSFLSPRPWRSPTKHPSTRENGLFSGIRGKFYRSTHVSDETTGNGNTCRSPNLDRPSTRHKSCGSTESFDSDTSDCSHPDLAATSANSRPRSVTVTSKYKNCVNKSNGFDNITEDNKFSKSPNVRPPGTFLRWMNGNANREQERLSPTAVRKHEISKPAGKIKKPTSNLSSENLPDAEDTNQFSEESKNILTDLVWRNGRSCEKDRLINGKLKSYSRSRLTRIVEVDGITYRVTMGEFGKVWFSKSRKLLLNVEDVNLTV